MEVKDAIKARHSVRNFENIPVADDVLLRVLGAVRLAPSAGNRQLCKFIVVKDSERKEALASAAGGQNHIASAPVVIAVVATMPEYIMFSGVPAYAIDTGIALDHVSLAAVEEGLGTCWVGAFSQEKAREILQVPENCMVAALMPLGYTKQKAGQKARKPLSELVCYETFKE